MPRFAANLSFLFTDLPFLDRFEAAARADFEGVEFMFPYATPKEEIRERLDATGLTMVLFNLPPGHWDKGERGFAALPGREDEFASAVDLALGYAETLRCPRLHVLAGLNAHGASRDIYMTNLCMAADWAAPLGIDILIEPINTRDMPDYFLTRTADARDVIADVGASNLGLQFDLYHRHMMEGDIEAALNEFGPMARHIQCADPPDRGEPSNRTINHTRLFELIDASGYNGWIGCEYKPRGATLDGLAWREECGGAPG